MDTRCCLPVTLCCVMLLEKTSLQASIGFPPSEMALTIEGLHNQDIIHNNTNSTKFIVGGNRLMLVDFERSFVAGDKRLQKTTLR